MPGIPLIARGAFPASGALGPLPPPGPHPVPPPGDGPLLDGVGPPPVQADIHSYEPPWKALCDFALHSDLDKLNMANSPQYNQLVSQVRQIVHALRRLISWPPVDPQNPET